MAFVYLLLCISHYLHAPKCLIDTLLLPCGLLYFVPHILSFLCLCTCLPMLHYLCGPTHDIPFIPINCHLGYICLHPSYMPSSSFLHSFQVVVVNSLVVLSSFGFHPVYLIVLFHLSLYRHVSFSSFAESAFDAFIANVRVRGGNSLFVCLVAL